MDSDIFLPYGYMQSQQNTQKSPYPPHFSSTQLNAPESDRKLQDAAGESSTTFSGKGLVSWVVSNCKTESKREEYVEVQFVSINIAKDSI